jgi:hypothetical protein
MRAKRNAEWLQLQTGDVTADRRSGELEQAPRLSKCERIRERLEERGVAPDLSEALAAQLEDRAAELDRDRFESLLDGVALACGLHGDAGEELTRNTSELREIERMMGAFAGELSKLDETLEVLAAYVRRMRSGVAEREVRVLH